jgi:hypothetical protein
MTDADLIVRSFGRAGEVRDDLTPLAYVTQPDQATAFA